MKILFVLVALSLFASAAAISLADAIFEQLEIFVGNGGNLVSKDAADLIILTLGHFDMATTGFSKDDLDNLQYFFYTYILGVVQIYKSGLTQAQTNKAGRL
ncbi:hypothetical protein L596_008466 [Steinernema carpocapsae]|uniref:Uncharacterized protein n=1 Tax=Steinernema carpocapsae TaxID=34508 RepID=A0A4U5PCK5_STECR|nr:hypothetical protein L596_008466 [Steinernema carpocapsae]